MTFMARACASGWSPAELQREIEDAISAWHDLESSEVTELHDFLGMTWEQYAEWVLQPSALTRIVQDASNEKNEFSTCVPDDSE